MPRTFQMGKEKVWSIERQGKKIVVRWGKVGGKQQAREKRLNDDFTAETDLRKQVKKKLGEGYKETTPKGAMPVLGTTGQALVEALADHPDDLAGHMAFADWLSEQPDAKLQTWGEFVRVQLALEDKALPAGQKRKLKKREAELRDAGQRDWLGEDLAQYLLEIRTSHLPKFLQEQVGLYEWTFARGWVDTLVVGYLTVKLAELMARAPALRLCRELTIGDTAHRGNVFAALAGAANLTNVRVLRIDNVASNHSPAPLVARLPRLEHLRFVSWGPNTAGLMELPSLAHLHTLEIGGLEGASLAPLAANPALKNLRKLGINCVEEIVEDFDIHLDPLSLEAVRPLFRAKHLEGLRDLALCVIDLGDEGCRELVASGLLARLEALNLSYNGIGDEGAAALADCPDQGRLRSLDISGNHLTPAGVRRLRRPGLKVTARYQGPDEVYLDLYEDEWE